MRLRDILKETSENRILILCRNFSQTAADSLRFEPDACSQHRFIENKP